MIRAILGTILGYVVLFVVLTALLFGAYFAMGVERSFQPESYEPSTLWLVVMFIAGLIAAVAGGFIGRKIGGAGGVKGLVGLIIILAGVEIGYQVLREEEASEKRGGDVTAMEAGMKARPPLWVMLVNPVIGIVGVLVGAGKAGKKKG